MANLELFWVKCNPNSVWCDFLKLNIDHEHFKELKGVYLIFTKEGVVIRVGSGVIKDRLKDHRDNEEILAYPNLLVTWAKVNANQMEGVEKFLADTYNPKIGKRFPDRTPIEVNLPNIN